MRMARIMPATRHVKVLILMFIAIPLSAATMGPNFQLVAQSQMQESLPSIGVDGVVVWNDSVARAGRVASAQPISDATELAAGPYRDSGVASIGDESMVIFIRNDDLWGQRIGADGKPAGAPIYLAFTDSRHSQRIAIAASRDRYLVVRSASSVISGSILDAAGNILDFSIGMTGGEYGRYVERISAASNGDEFLLVWDTSTSEPWSTPCALACPGEDRDVHAVIVGNDGHPRPETERILASGAGDPDVASNGHDYFVTWSRFGGGLTGQKIGAGLATAGEPITITTGRDFGSHVAWDGALYDLAWIHADNSPVLMSDRINDSGAVVEPLLNGIFGGFQSRDFDLTAGGGNIVFAVPVAGHLRLQYLSVTPAPVGRVRSVRH